MSDEEDLGETSWRWLSAATGCIATLAEKTVESASVPTHDEVRKFGFEVMRIVKILLRLEERHQSQNQEAADKEKAI
jgi:hypothetical protein